MKPPPWLTIAGAEIADGRLIYVARVAEPTLARRVEAARRAPPPEDGAGREPMGFRPCP